MAAAQAVHAAIQFSFTHPEITSRWHEDSQFLVLVSVPTESALIDLTVRAERRDIPTSLWAEPDMDCQVTALALGPGEAAGKLCANLPLHGRSREAVAA